MKFLIKKFEAGYWWGWGLLTPPRCWSTTGSFDNGLRAAGGCGFALKGCEVFQPPAAMQGAIQAVKEAHAAGKAVYAIGVDSDQSHLAPDAMLTSMTKRVDLAVWQAASDLKAGKFTPGDVVMGLKEDGVGYAPVRVELQDKAARLGRVEALRAKIVSGEVKVPSNAAELAGFVAPAL